MKFGTIVPNGIEERVEKILAALAECLPYQDDEDEANVNLLDVVVEEASDLLRFAVAIRDRREQGERKTTLAEQHTRVRILFANLSREVCHGFNMKLVLHNYIEAESPLIGMLDSFVTTCTEQRQKEEVSYFKQENRELTADDKDREPCHYCVNNQNSDLCGKCTDNPANDTIPYA